MQLIKIESFLKTLGPEFDIEVFTSYQSGLKKLVDVMPDLIILDMSLPTFDRGGNQREGRLRPLGGYEIMRKLNLRNIEFKSIVVTQLESFGEGGSRVTFDEMNEKCKSEFPTKYLGSVFFGQSDDNWKSGLKELIEKHD